MQSTNRPLLLPANHPNSKIPSVSQHFFKYIYYCKSTDYKFPFQKSGKTAGFWNGNYVFGCYSRSENYPTITFAVVVPSFTK